MNEDFLSQFRESPRPDFTQSLYTKLMQEAGAQGIVRRSIIAKQIGVALAALCLAFALAMAVSPAVRAAVSDLLAKIIVRGTTVFVNDDVPAVQDEGESYTMVWTPVSPNKISSDYPFFAKLPTWIPAGYVLQDRAGLYYGSMPASKDQDKPSYAAIEWKNDNGGVIQLNIQRGSCLNGPSYDSGAERSDCTHQVFFSVGLESQPQVMAVNDQPAVLFHHYLLLTDMSDPVRPWNPSRYKFSNRDPGALFLIWETDERTFWIAVKSRDISVKELMRLAESIP